MFRLCFFYPAMTTKTYTVTRQEEANSCWEVEARSTIEAKNAMGHCLSSTRLQLEISYEFQVDDESDTIKVRHLENYAQRLKVSVFCRS